MPNYLNLAISYKTPLLCGVKKNKKIKLNKELLIMLSYIQEFYQF